MNLSMNKRIKINHFVISCPREGNFHAVRVAVLNKCAAKCRILHCEVDGTSGCVYLKCENQGDAAIAYQNLHGWWYECK